MSHPVNVGANDSPASRWSGRTDRIAALGQVEQLVTAEYPLRVIEEHTQQAVLCATEGNHGAVFIEQVARGGIEAPAAQG